MAAERLPQWVRVRQKFPGKPVADLPRAVADCLAALGAPDAVRPGQTVAVTAGSRGIANIVAVTAAAVAELKRLGAEPFVFPCMGSHGGARPEGQLAVLTSYGLTPEAVGCPVVSRGEVVSVGKTASGIPLWCDKLAFEANHILVINRVKPHTDYTGLIESGPSKMLAIGLGKHHSAGDCHKRFVQRGYEEVLLEVSDALWDKLKVLGGIGLVENGHEQTIAIAPIRRQWHKADESNLLRRAREVFGKLPFDKLHILIIDEIGKDISGAGMDPNVTGRDCAYTHRAPDKPDIIRILVRGLTANSHGNATGIGQADFALQRCLDAVDWAATATNCLISSAPEAGRRPLSCPTDQALLAAACLTIGAVPPEQIRLVRLKNTLAVDEFLASTALIPEIKRAGNCTIEGDPFPITFDEDGFLPCLI